MSSEFRFGLRWFGFSWFGLGLGWGFSALRFGFGPHVHVPLGSGGTVGPGLHFCDHAALPFATASSTGTRAKAVVGLVACITLFMSAMRSSVAMSSACGCAVSGSVKKMMPPRSSSTICVPTCEPDYTRVSLG